MNAETPASLANPNSIEARDRRSVIHGLTDLAVHQERGPVVMESGRGVWVRDIHGNEYIEGMSGLWCIALGYGQKRLVAAAAQQMEKLAYYHLTNHRGHERVVELAEKLLAIAPVPMTRVWFANSGSEANDCAARIAWYYWNAVGKPEKRKFIAHLQAYHGNTIATASLSGVGYAHQRFNLPLEGFLHVACPDRLRNGLPGESEAEFARRLLADIEALILREGPETIAAFFTEPVLAAGGVVVPPEGYFAGLQALLKKYDILLVSDEVVTGFGRIGEMFGATAMGLKPDMLVAAKALSSAYIPISAVLVNDRIFEAMMRQSGELGVFGLTMTYSGHPVAAAVALEALAIYEEEDIAGRVARLEDAFLGGLRRRFRDHPRIAEVRGQGLLAGVQLVRSRAPLAFFPPAAGAGKLWAEAAERRGLIVRAIGDTIALCPPLIISEDEIAMLIDRLALALDDVEPLLAP
ncbi:aminotransferase [Aquabacter sp. CN5-332]|uniref:aminotransferase n=1 Tax=Aquabacter sp. CN5-332 TaxID=3156608 RepID=UPI0032B3F65B